MSGIDAFLAAQQPTARRPLLGLTVLLVEDSRYTCEAVRLLCTRSGARIRRADSLSSARKHLAVYHPAVVIVDVGLPDGSGIGLIEGLAYGSPRIDIIIGISGDPEMESAVMEAGADGFIAKPFASVAAFQTAILRHLPADRRPNGPVPVSKEEVSPDLIAFQDDLVHASELLHSPDPEQVVDYICQFLSSLARSAEDTELSAAVDLLATDQREDRPLQARLAEVTALVEERLASAAPI